MMPPGVGECFLPGGAAGATYGARLLAKARLHHVAAKDGVDAWRDVALLAEIPATGEPDWASAQVLAEQATVDAPAEGAGFEPLPAPVTAACLAAWTRSLARHVQEAQALRLFRCEALDAVSRADETEGAFRGRLAHEARERRDASVEKLRSRHRPALARLEERLRKAEQRIAVQQDQASHQRTSAVVSAGSAVLGAIFGRRASALGRAAGVARGFGRASQEGRDVERAEADAEAVRADIARLEEQLAAGIQELEASLDPAALVLEEIRVPPRKADGTSTLQVCWCLE